MRSSSAAMSPRASRIWRWAVQFEVVARQVAGQRQPGQVQQRGLADYVGVRPLDGAAHAAPQVQFPGRVEAGLI